MRYLAIIVVVIGFAADMAAQRVSLAEIAEREAQRRANVSKGKVYTNADLKPADAPSAPAEPVVSPTAATNTSAPGPAEKADNSNNAAGAPVKAREKRDAAFWREREAELQTRVQGLRANIAALESGLSESASSPGAAQERALAEATLNKLRAELRDFEEEVRKFEARAPKRRPS